MIGKGLEKIIKPKFSRPFGLLQVFGIFCHPERNEVKPKDLRTKALHSSITMRRFFDSLRSLRMTSVYFLTSLC